MATWHINRNALRQLPQKGRHIRSLRIYCLILPPATVPYSQPVTDCTPAARFEACVLVLLWREVSVVCHQFAGDCSSRASGEAMGTHSKSFDAAEVRPIRTLESVRGSNVPQILKPTFKVYLLFLIFYATIAVHARSRDKNIIVRKAMVRYVSFRVQMSNDIIRNNLNRHFILNNTKTVLCIQITSSSMEMFQ